MIQREKTLEKFGVDINKLSDGSHKRVIIQCDYCGADTENSYKNYIISKKTTVIDKDCCIKCRGVKAKECNAARDRSKIIHDASEKRKKTCLERYGVEHPSQNANIIRKVVEAHNQKSEEEKLEIIDKRRETITEKYGDWGDMFSKKMTEKYGVDHCPQTEEMKEKRKATNLEKYGVEFVGQVEEFKEKAKQTSLEKYGHEYHTQRDEFKKLISQKDFGWHSEAAREKRILTNLKRFGCENPLQNEEIKSRMIQTKIDRGYINFVEGKTDQEWATETGISRTYANAILRKYGPEALINFKKGRTSIETIIKIILEKNNISFKEQPIFPNGFGDGHKRGDFLIENTNLIIEANGTFWHSEDVKGKTYHKEKREFYLKNGYNCLFFNEDEIMFKSSIVESIILNKLGLTNNKIWARKCSIREIKTEESRVFYTENHLMGKSSGRTFGLIYQNKLVSCLQFRKKEGGYEIARFCNLLNHSIVGGFSKLLSHGIKELNASKIITFIDLRYGTGDYLAILGFKKQSEYLSFRWVGQIETFHRMQFPGNTGIEKGYKKIWDCGQAKWVKIIDNLNLSVKAEDNIIMKQTIKNKKSLVKSGVQKVKTAEDQDLTNIKSIDSLWGFDTSKYKQKTIKQYQEFLNQMTNSELEIHCYEIGVSQNLEKEDIFAQLTRLFNKDLATRNKPANQNVSVITPDMNKKLIEIMNS